MIRVKNKRKGVRPEYAPSAAIQFYVGRPSILGNPFEIGEDGTREEVIRKYRGWLLWKIEERKGIWELLGAIHAAALNADIDLVCWCAPEPCHADEIKAVLDQGIEVSRPVCAECGREATTVIHGENPVYLCDVCPVLPYLEEHRRKYASEPDGPHPLLEAQ